ncbi:tail protein X [Vibrio ostreicida]|uniref:Tail protein X n=1 Tax=Vibrio ostreicida TaxID=526588 RepID=A0ABT8BWI6_9VIBR|nr:tail protein X [Vibrio ostreicida]MDN3611358.1 tail protein X [Vibrio ostreicida]NPD09294.1 phage tail protein [Vibrio ostreicida]
MVTIYRTREGDMVDEICWRHYGRESAVVAVLKANPGLADCGPLLPSGIALHLPHLPTSVVREPASLWD